MWEFAKEHPVAFVLAIFFVAAATKGIIRALCQVSQ